MRRELSTLSGKIYDVCVVGGGINGASAAQHMAAAGYRTLLVEKDDFGSGSSSRSSRLIHCGLRFLAPGFSAWEWLFRPLQLKNALMTVRRSMRERSRIVHSYPSRTRKLNFAYAVWDDSAYSPWQVMFALELLKHLGPGDVPLNPRHLRPAEIAKTPLLNLLRDQDSLRSACLYDEFQFDWPERVTMDMVLDAERLGATVRNYTSVSSLTREGDHWRIELTDNIESGSTASISAALVINTAGIWVRQGQCLIRPIRLTESLWNQRMPYRGPASTGMRELRGRDIKSEPGTLLLHTMARLSLFRTDRDAL